MYRFRQILGQVIACGCLLTCLYILLTSETDLDALMAAGIGMAGLLIGMVVSPTRLGANFKGFGDNFPPPRW